MKHIPDEEGIRKKAIFDTMSPMRQKQILKKGYDNWEPFIEPKDPVDIRKDKTNRTTHALIREFFQSRPIEGHSDEYGRGVFDICLGIINEDERSLGMFDFACWYQELLKKEYHEKQE